MPEPVKFFGISIEAGLWLFIAILGFVAAIVAARKKRRRFAELGDEEIPAFHDDAQLEHGDVIHFIILSAARTGSTLLRHMLGSQPGVFAGGEIFNPVEIESNIITWCEPSSEKAQINQDENLLRLRTSDPVRFIDELIKTTEGWGYPVVGFKWHYWFPNPDDPAGQYLIKDKRIRVLHVKRRNLLRRLISHERALITDSWSRLPGSKAPELPTVNLPMKKFIDDVREIEAAEKLYDQCVKEHPVLEIFYEDLAEDPKAVAARALNFLGVKVSRELQIPLEKTGVDSLRTAVENYDELKSSLHRWASFFDD